MTQLHLFPLPDQQSSGPQPSPKNEEAIDKNPWVAVYTKLYH